jgi:threonine synthase
MDTTDRFAGLSCLACDRQFDATTATHRCPDCGGVLEPTYGDLADAHARLFEEGERTGAGIARYAPVLPVSDSALVTTGEGTTPLVDCPALADELGVGDLLVKDEGRNGTGSVADRGMALAVTAAREAGAETVALPSAGNSGQSASAYAARAGLDAESFVPSRTTFANKALINVHGGEMTVVGGRYPDAADVFADASEDEDWHSLAAFAEPYRSEGLKTLAYDLVADLGAAPDAVVVPVAHGLALAGIDRGFRELAATGTIDQRPRLYAAQAEGCAPVVDAWEQGQDSVSPTEHPDTICGELEIPDPAGGEHVLDAIEASDGGAVATDDDAILESAVTLAGMGVPASATGGAAASGAHELAERGAFDDEATVVLVDPSSANREADILRSHLMKQGI